MKSYIFKVVIEPDKFEDGRDACIAGMTEKELMKVYRTLEGIA